ncbi:hypothetical protein GALMADRAFT_236862 [Galerina marginata CBS 339.88]|uniref:Uncharacterized protein n=1 Tax=Galerina marginata (strain CBS 339.88) TaxID=685588 RepID=A0A067TLX1_GALM3|nr:hypothetical protein GALMADRAFT_236862 [Galerina marginata CBS 339.88]
MFVPNHHQQNGKKRSLPPSGPPPLRDQATPSTPGSAPTAKSPHTDKIIKKSRIDGTHSPPQTSQDLPLPTQPTPIETVTPKPPASAGNHRPTTNLNKVELSIRQLLAIYKAQLDTLETTVSQIMTYQRPDPEASHPKVLLLKTQSALSSLGSFADYLSPETSQGETQTSSGNPPTDPPNPTTTTPSSYADTVKATLPIPTRGKTSKTTQRTKQAVKSAVPPTRRDHSSRVIVDFRDSDIQILQGNVPKATPLTLRTSINDLFLKAQINVSVSAVTITKTGNVIVAPTAPYTASQLASNKVDSIVLINAIVSACGYNETDHAHVSVYEDTPWHRVVVHGIPKLTNNPQEDWVEGELDTELKTYNPSINWVWSPKHGRDYRVLCRKDDWSQKEVVSICLAFRDGAMARLAIRNGVAAFGAHCRVSPYRPLIKARTSPTTAAC